MTKIVCLANSIWNTKGRSGGDVIFMEAAKRFSNEFDITVITSVAGYSQWQEFSQAKVKYICLSGYFFEKYLSLAMIPLVYVLRALETLLLFRKVDFNPGTVVYSSSDFICDTIPSAFVKLFNKRVKWISRIYHVIPAPGKREGVLLFNILSFLAQRFSFFLIKHFSDVVLSLNDALSAELIALNFPQKKIKVSGAGIDFKYIDKIPDCSEKVYDGVFFGRISPQKGIYDLIKIWDIVVKNKKNARLAIIGGGSPEAIADLNKEIQGYNLKDNVDYLGYIESLSDLYLALKKSRVYLFTDHENGWGISVAEGMACKLAVVAYKLDIFGAVHKKGFIPVPLKDIELFAKETLFLLNNDAERDKLAREAYVQAKGYDWDNIALELKGIIRELN
ncbi:MAG: glycosyltransferase family 4 protein [Candidatus Omnitrophota bacterium]|nr:glycosyltransferase family 4 protein [Candidatus Omnitrophota bacterium]MBU1929454.1 glycosyltransferase family 4 protein [Candidatus Omnitrophota bacterium]MBU2034822.1 glycosyltransferase family 4 protein [Candidatus Omnitrophota bacterium]